MRTTLSILLIIACSNLVKGQNPNGDYNPYVDNPEVTPSPIWTVQANGAGAVNFEIGNTGSDPLDVSDDQYITLTLTLSYGEPDAANPVDAVGGTAAGFFFWSYYNGTYSARQISAIPAGYSGIVTIDYRVTENSDAPGINGFNVNIAPAPYQTNSNVQTDDAVSYYTYSSDENEAPPAPTGLSLVSVSDQKVTFNWNPSSAESGIESYRIYRDNSRVGGTVDLTYTDSTVTSGASYTYAVSAVDSIGYESEQSDPLNVSVLSVNAFGANHLLIKPNPSNGVFQVNLDSSTYGEFILEIISAKGNMVVQRAVELQSQIDEITVYFDFLDNGIYTIRIYSQSRIYYGKLMIIR